MFKFKIKYTRTTSLTLYLTPCSSVSIANFEHVIAGWKRVDFFLWSRLGQSPGVDTYKFRNPTYCFSCFSKTVPAHFFSGNFKTIEEVVTAFDKSIFPKVWGASYLGLIQPLQWAITDITGRWDMKLLLKKLVFPWCTGKPSTWKECTFKKLIKDLFLVFLRSIENYLGPSLIYLIELFS